MRLHKLSSMILTAAVVCCAVVAQADVFNMGAGLTSLETVQVGNPGNAADTAVHSGNPAGQGAVGYAYNIGKYEVTAGQYTEFLNAKAQSDPYGLYNDSMWSGFAGCSIQRSGVSGSFAYSVAADYANRPVNFVSFWDAARFTNWLHNGQGTGDTETGAYTLTVGGMATNSIARNAGAQWWVPSENEWYKSAYHDKTAGLAAAYFLYPTASNLTPSNVLVNPTDPGNNATFSNSGSIGSPYYRTDVGAHEFSDSPYGTFDQGGNVWEWNDTVSGSSSSGRGSRGGAFYNGADRLASSYRSISTPTNESYYAGFRVASVPEPSVFAMLGLVGVAMAGYVWRRRKRVA